MWDPATSPEGQRMKKDCDVKKFLAAKKLLAARKRGFTLIETVLVLAVGLGLIVGGLVFFQQAQASSDLTEKTRVAVGVSSEVRAQFRTAADYNDGGSPGDSILGAVKRATALPESTFNSLDILGNDQEFDLVFTNLNENVCNRMATGDMGPNSTSDNTACASGTLTVTYSR